MPWWYERPKWSALFPKDVVCEWFLTLSMEAAQICAGVLSPSDCCELLVATSVEIILCNVLKFGFYLKELWLVIPLHK